MDMDMLCNLAANLCDYVSLVASLSYTASAQVEGQPPPPPR